MKRFAAVALMVLTACGGTAAGVSPSAAPPPSPSESASPSPHPSPSPCVDSTELLARRDSVSRHMDKAIGRLRRFDVPGTAIQVRLAASETRAMADLVGEIDQEIRDHFLRAADALDNAATALIELDLDQARTYVTQGNNEIRRAVNGVNGGAIYC